MKGDQGTSPGAARTAIRVKIAGESYTLRAAADEEHTRRCAALVDERMSVVAGRSGVSVKHAAIMAALALADELLRERLTVRDRIKGLTARIDAELRESG